MKDGENLVASVLLELGFRADRFPKDELRQGIKTPDFRVFCGKEFAMFCEEKTFTDSTSFYETLINGEPGVIVEEMQSGATKSNRLVNRLGDAVAKFQAVNPDHTTPNLIAIVNLDEMFFPDEITELFRGYAFVTNRTKCHTVPEVCRRRFADSSDWIDAILLLHRVKETKEEYNRFYYQTKALKQHPSLQLLLDNFKEWDGQQEN